MKKEVTQEKISYVMTNEQATLQNSLIQIIKISIDIIHNLRDYDVKEYMVVGYIASVLSDYKKRNYLLWNEQQKNAD